MSGTSGKRMAILISCVTHAGLVLVLWGTLWIAEARPPPAAEIRSEVAVATALEESPEEPPPVMPREVPEPELPRVVDAEPPAEEPFAPLPEPRGAFDILALPAHPMGAIRRVTPPPAASPPSTPPPTPVAAPAPRGPSRRARALPGNPAPAYPARAVRLEIEGTVLLVVSVSVGGRVEKIDVTESSGHEILDRAAIRAVKKWCFAPALRHGVPVRSRVVVPVRFALR